MNRTHLTASLAALAAIGLVAADASAVYNPLTGRFLQRDPGPGAREPMRVGTAGPAQAGSFVQRDPEPMAQYADGMSTYQYERSAPGCHVDPQGLRILIDKGKPKLAQDVSAALKKLCPCFKYEAARPDGHFEIKIKTWTGLDKKGKKKVFFYDPKDKAAKATFCKCYAPDEKAIKELNNTVARLDAQSPQVRLDARGEAATRIQAIAGNRGRWASCWLVAKAIDVRKDWPREKGELHKRKKQKRKIWISYPLGGPYTEGDTVYWNTAAKGFPGPAHIALGHELIHQVTGLGAELEEFGVVGYENALRWEGGQKLRLDYTGMPIVQYGDPLVCFPQVDKCECDTQ